MFDLASALVVAGAGRCLLLALPPGPGQRGHGVDGADGEFGAKVGGGTVELEGGRGIGQLGAPVIGHAIVPMVTRKRASA
jgi:hypothetical protein